jgi:hypothetical protein
MSEERVARDSSGDKAATTEIVGLLSAAGWNWMEDSTNSAFSEDEGMEVLGERRRFYAAALGV